MQKQKPIRPTNEEAIRLAKSLIQNAKYGSLAVVHPSTGNPHVTRIAVSTASNGGPITLVSDLSVHTKALRENSHCSLLLGEPGSRGDPLNHPRITLSCKAEFADKTSLRAIYLDQHPKAKLYIDFADFHFVKFEIISADLNGGFGKAFQLKPSDFS